MCKLQTNLNYQKKTQIYYFNYQQPHDTILKDTLIGKLLKEPFFLVFKIVSNSAGTQKSKAYLSLGFYKKWFVLHLILYIYKKNLSQKLDV